MRKIPLKNYIILIIVTIATFALTILLRNLYLDKRNFESNSNSIMGFLQELKDDEIDSYITENRDFILYVSNANDSTMSEFENSLKDAIINEDYIKNMVYLNADINELNNIKKYLTENIEIEDIPNVMIFKDGKIVGIYYPKTDEFDISKIILYIEMNLDDNE